MKKKIKTSSHMAADVHDPLGVLKVLQLADDLIESWRLLHPSILNKAE